MASGGARNRSGPSADPTSARSDRRGFTLTALPNGGFDGEVPAFPLPQMRRMRWVTEDKKRWQEFDAESTELYRDREVDVWAELWRTPQACAWSLEPWRWSTVAEFCRLKTIVEQEPDANASLVAQLHRYRDQIGLTPAGLKENGWAIAPDEVGAKAGEKKPSAPTRKSSRDRLKAVPGAAAGA